MGLSNFMIEQGVLAVTMGTMIGFGTTSFAKQIREHIFTPLIQRLVNIIRCGPFRKMIPATIRNPVIGVVSAMLELLLLVSLVMIFYEWFVLPIFRNELEEQKEDARQEDAWRQDMLTQVERIAKKPVYLY